jgi:hypothetical protein
MNAVNRTAIALASLVVLAAITLPQFGRDATTAAAQGRISTHGQVLVSLETPEALQSDMTYGDRTMR